MAPNVTEESEIRGFIMDLEDYDVKHAKDLHLLFEDASSDIKDWVHKWSELDKRKRIVNQQVDGQTALFRACVKGDVSLVNYFLGECGADIEQVCTYTVKEDNNSVHIVPPIWVASIMGHINVVKALLTHGANVNGCSDSNSTAVRTACYKCDIDMVRYLVGQGADINIPNKYGSTCLMNAVCNEDLVKYLIENGANINVKETEHLQLTAVHYAVHNNCIDSLRVLIDAGADIDVKDKDSCTPLISAALFHHKDIVDFLLSEIPQTIETQITTYEILGTAAMDEDDFESAANYWQEAYLLRDENKDLVQVTEPNTDKCSLDSTSLPETLTDFIEMQKDHESLYNLAIFIKGKYFGPLHEEFLYTQLMHADRKFRDDKYIEALNLFKLVHSQFLKKEKWLHENNIFALASYIRVASIILGKNDCENQSNELVVDCANLFSSVVNQVKMASQLCKVEKERENIDAYHNLLCSLLYLFSIVVKRRQSVSPSKEFISAVQDLVKFNPRFENEDTLLHVVVDKEMFEEVNPNIDLSYSPVMDTDTISALHAAGLSLNTKGNNGMTVLHKYLCCYNFNLEAMDGEEDVESHVHFLLGLNAHIDTVDSSGNSCLEKLHEVASNVNELTYRNLRCFAAECIVKNRIPYADYIPQSLIPYVELHL